MGDTIRPFAAGCRKYTTIDHPHNELFVLEHVVANLSQIDSGAFIVQRDAVAASQLPQAGKERGKVDIIIDHAPTVDIMPSSMGEFEDLYSIAVLREEGYEGLYMGELSNRILDERPDDVASACASGKGFSARYMVRIPHAGDCPSLHDLYFGLQYVKFRDGPTMLDLAPFHASFGLCISGPQTYHFINEFAVGAAASTQELERLNQNLEMLDKAPIKRHA